MYDILATSAHSRHEHDPPQISPGQVRCGFDRVAVDFHGPHVTSRPAGQPEGAAEDATAVSEGGLERPQSTPSRPQVSRKFL